MSKPSLEERIEAAVLHSWAVRDFDGGKDEPADPKRAVAPIKALLAEAYQRGITDALNSLPAPSQRSATSLGPDTLNKDYQRGNFDGYNEYYSQAKKNLTKLKEGK